MLHYIQISPMSKCIGERLKSSESYIQTRVLKGEYAHFQIALWSDSSHPKLVKLKDCSESFTKIYLTKAVPVSFSNYSEDCEKYYDPEMEPAIPDCLTPLSPMDTLAVGNTPILLWVTAYGHFSGEYVISYEFSDSNNSIKTDFRLKILDLKIPEGRCPITAKISVNSIASEEKIPPYCNLFWENLSAHFKLAAKHGISNIITPLFASEESRFIGCSSDQLIKITVDNKKFKYNYDALDSWLFLAKKEGIEHFTFSSIFPSMIHQKCPRIYSEGYRTQHLLFSEEDEILSDNYLNFICDFLKNLNKHLREIQLNEQVTFIITDHITPEYASVYNECFQRIKKALCGQKIISYMRQFDSSEFIGFPSPIVAMSAVKPYLSLPIGPSIHFDPNDATGFMNQLIAAPSMRIRSFGLLSFLHDFSGIILDYYNFTIDPITQKDYNPFLSPDANGAYPAGSLFMVYNHPNGPYPSIRLLMLKAALQDAVALRLLENYVPKERIVSMIMREIPISEDQCLIDVGKFQKLRDKIYDLFEKHIKSK